MAIRLSETLTTTKGPIKLTVEVGMAPWKTKLNTEFMVFDTLSPYDVVM